jgi:hypothetical protein
MVACQGRGVVAATHAGVVSSDDAQGIRRVLAMTDDELKAIEARANAATPGPWHLAITGDDDPDRANIEAGAIDVCDNPTNDDATFIAHARTDVPALVAEVRRLRRHSEALYELLSLRDVHIEPKNKGDAQVAATLTQIMRHAVLEPEVFERLVDDILMRRPKTM